MRIDEFAIGVYEVTFLEWDACVAETGCSHRPDDNDWGRGSHPVTNVSWNDINEYLRWINQKTGERYRLPSEAEWEYAARAGTKTAYTLGNDIGVDLANCDGCSSQWDCNQTMPVGSFPANALGLYDVHGNVWEWTEDCYTKSYKRAPTDGSAWTRGGCFSRVLRGGSWYSLRRGCVPPFAAGARRTIVGTVSVFALPGTCLG